MFLRYIKLTTNNNLFVFSVKAKRESQKESFNPKILRNSWLRETKTYYFSFNIPFIAPKQLPKTS